MNIYNLDPFEFSMREIGGMPVYYKNLPWAPCIHIYFTLNRGGLYDPKGKEGLSHFLEHMIGNGSPNLPDKKAVKNFSRLYMLNSRNAYTSLDSTSYVGKCLPEHFTTVVANMKDYVFHPYLRPEDVEHERKVISQEAWLRYKNPNLLKFVRRFIDNIYHGHERGNLATALGWPETIAAITHEDIKEFHKGNYIKENFCLLLVGKVEDEHLAALEEIFKNLPSGNKFSPSASSLQRPKATRIEADAEDIGDPHEQVEVSFTRALPPSEDASEVASQAKILLYDALLERLRVELSLCYSVKIVWRELKTFTEIDVRVDTSEDNASLVEKEVWSVVEEIIGGKYKERFADTHKMSLDQIRSKERVSESIIETADHELILYGHIIPLRESIEEASKVTYEDVATLIEKAFDKEHVVTTIIHPSPK